MDQLQQEFNSIIQTFLKKRDGILEGAIEAAAQLEKELALLKMQNINLCSENEKLKRETAKFKKGIREILEKADTVHAPAQLSASEDGKEGELHSIKDRVKQMGYNLEKISNTDLAHIGKQMANYYRQTYEKDPEKREEKINEKHNSLVCVYSKNDWAYIDELIKIQLFDDTDGTHNENDAPVLYSIKDRIHNRFNQEPQNYAPLLPTIGKKMAAYYRKTYKGKNPAKRDEKINDTHTHPVCVYGEDDWEYLDYLITTELKI